MAADSKVKELFALLAAQYGTDTAAIEAGYLAARPATFRYNTLKISPQEGDEAIHSLGLQAESVPLAPFARVLRAGEETLRKSALYEGGNLYFQSLSSMLPPIYLGPEAGESILDMTAAPGGKTTELVMLSGGKALVTACERDKVRFERLKFNLARQGATRVTALCTDASALDDAFSFDKILLDAPCTGSGTITPAKPARFSVSYLEKCAALQEKLLKKALKLLKRGGTMVYSTCSVLRRENEEVLARCLKGTDCHVVPVMPPAGVPLLPSEEGTVTVCPSELYEGFFLAKIKKEG